MSEKEVGKSSFWRDGQEISFVLWVDLDAKTNCRGGKGRGTNVDECSQSSGGKRNGLRDFSDISPLTQERKIGFCFFWSVSYPCEWLLMQTEMLV